MGEVVAENKTNNDIPCENGCTRYGVCRWGWTCKCYRAFTPKG